MTNAGEWAARGALQRFMTGDRVGPRRPPPARGSRRTFFLAAMLGVGVAHAVALSSAVSVSNGATPVSLEALVNLNVFPATDWAPGQYGSLSPDGRWFAYTVRATRLHVDDPGTSADWYTSTGMRSDSAGTDLWVSDTQTGRAQRITDGKGLVEEPAWSPDGVQLAFYADREGQAQLWIWDRMTRALRRVTDAAIQPMMFPRLTWSPDGRLLGVLLRPAHVPSTPGPGVPGPALSKEGTAAASGKRSAAVQVYSAHAQSQAAHSQYEQTGGKALEDVRLDSSIRFDPVGADVGIVSVRDGRLRVIAHDKVVYWYDFSPDGRSIAFSHFSGWYVGGGQSVCDYEVAAITDEVSHTLARQVRADYCVASWSPDSSRLAYMTNGPMADGDLHLLSLRGADRQVTTVPHPRLQKEGPWYPLWDAAGRTLYIEGAHRLWKVPVDSDELIALTPEGWDREVTDIVAKSSRNQIWTGGVRDTITICTRHTDTQEAGFYRLDPETGRASKLREEARAYGSDRSPPMTSADGSTIVYLAEDAQHPVDAWASNFALADARPITRLNPQLSSAQLGKVRILRYRGSRGQLLRAALVLPSGYRTNSRYPLISILYPGHYSHSGAAYRFGTGHEGLINSQMLASRGYAVLVPDLPQEEVGAPVRELVQELDSALDVVVSDAGIADPNRLGVLGHSYGGYATLAAVTELSRFKAAVVNAGLGDLTGFYLWLRPASPTDGRISWAESGQGLMGGSLWRYPERYRQNSPILHLDRVRAPVLVIHGDADPSVPIWMSEQIFVGLRRLGREVEYRRYAGEGHVISRMENVLDYWESVIRWFDQYVRAADPAP